MKEEKTERRRDRRISVGAKMSIDTLNGNYMVYVKDVSAAGVGFSSPVRIPMNPGEKIRFNFRDDSLNGVFMRVDAMCTRTDEHTWTYGCIWNPNYKNIFQDYINRMEDPLFAACRQEEDGCFLK